MISGPTKVAFVCDWLIVKGGAETVLEAMLKNWPDAPVYTLVYDVHSPVQSVVEGHPVITSFLQRLPQAARRYRSFLPLMPFAIEQFDLSEFDLVISSSHAVGKGVLTGADQLHISYVHTPMRYAWDLRHQYMKEARLERGMKGFLLRWLMHYIRLWDVRTAHGVDEFIAISQFVAQRIRKTYGRAARVIYPPVDIGMYQLHEEKEDFYLTASRMVPYKRLDLIVDAFASMPEKRLVIIGDGPDFKKLKARARAHPNIELLGYQPPDALKHYMQRAKAFVFAAVEDFGIVLVEAQACATPVIAFGRGGARETVIDRKTGLLFPEQTVASLREGVLQFERESAHLDRSEMRRNAERFGEDRFQCEFREFVERVWAESRPG